MQFESKKMRQSLISVKTILFRGNHRFDLFTVGQIDKINMYNFFGHFS